jgi:hypothetical protein
MKPRKIISKRRYYFAFLIATLIFLIGISITYSIAYFEFQRISNLQEPISYKIFEDKLHYTLFNKDICLEKNYIAISENLAFQGGIIGQLEEKMGKKNKDVIFRKKFYSLILVEHFELVRLLNEKCDKKINTILFFYSNEEKEIDYSEDVGALLGVLYEQSNDDLVIYSFDINLDSRLIRSLKEVYDVSGPMNIIVNENQKLSSLNNLDEISKFLV